MTYLHVFRRVSPAVNCMIPNNKKLSEETDIGMKIAIVLGKRLGIVFYWVYSIVVSTTVFRGSNPGRGDVI